jgi:ATP-dependent RNA helicase RhlB
LPLILAGDDMAGQAQTGTGKTAAFLLATMQYLLINEKSVQPRALIMSPTRELAIQIYNDAMSLGQFTDLSIGLVYGGVDYKQQRDMVAEGVDILIGTPGRLIDYQKQGVLKLKYIEVMVLDEADRMFDLGFIKDIRFLLRRMPKAETRLNMLFSATLSWRVTELAYEHMNSPDIIRINPEQVTADKVTQCLYHVSKEEKTRLLIGLLRHIDPKRTIVFVNTKRTAEMIWGYLEGNGFHSAILSGDVPQAKRQTLFKSFSEGNLPILVATDLAARGLHIPEVSHIFNYDLPQNAEDYVHRIGRTARAGEAGDAVSFACEEYVFSLPEIEDYIGHKIPTEAVVDDSLAELQPPVRIKKSKKPFSKGRGKGRDTRSKSRRPRPTKK